MVMEKMRQATQKNPLSCWKPPNQVERTAYFSMESRNQVNGVRENPHTTKRVLTFAVEFLQLGMRDFG